MKKLLKTQNLNRDFSLISFAQNDKAIYRLPRFCYAKSRNDGFFALDSAILYFSHDSQNLKFSHESQNLDFANRTQIAESNTKNTHPLNPPPQGRGKSLCESHPQGNLFRHCEANRRFAEAIHFHKIPRKLKSFFIIISHF
ncbi:hypothetical protein [Helicobacter sp. 23-1045]